MAIESWVTDEDTNFQVGDSPKTIAVYSGTLHPYPVCEGYIACDGTGNIEVAISQDGTNYGDTVTMKTGEVVTLGGSRVGLIKLTHTGTDSAYRVLVVPVRYHDY
jgi:hypothetical protein